MKIHNILCKSLVIPKQQVYGCRHLILGTMVKVSYLDHGVYQVSESGRKDTVGLLGEDKAIAISPSDS
jgi:hypothetical protein